MDTKPKILPYTPEWYEARLGRFTSSEIWKLIGEARSKKDREAGLLSEQGETYAFEKAAEILTDAAGKEAFGEAIDWGHAHEEDAAQAFSEATGLRVEPGYLLENELYCGTPDRTGEAFILEIKCPFNTGNHLRYLGLNSPAGLLECKKEYYWQCVANMELAGASRAYFVSFDPRVAPEFRLKVLEIPRSEADAERLREAVMNAEMRKTQIIVSLYQRLESTEN